MSLASCPLHRLDASGVSGQVVNSITFSRKTKPPGDAVGSALDFLLDRSGIPHGYCIAWDARLLWIMVASNALVALAYFSIPIALWRFLRLQSDLPFKGIFVLFSAFIFFCGVTHLIDILNIYRPAYRLDAMMMALTALVSVATATTLFPLVPEVSRYLTVSREQGEALEQANRELRETTTQLELRTAESEEARRQFEQMLFHTPIGMAIVAPDGRWLKVNRALCHMLGYSEPELLATDFQHITHPDDLESDLASVRQLLEGRISGYQMHKRYLTREGRTLWVQLDVTLLRDRDGNPLHFVAQIQDISARLTSEEAIRMSEEKARLLSTLDGVLQACQSLAEVGPPVARACRAAYPGSAGTILVRNPSRNLVEQLHGWGTRDCGAALFVPEDCWAIRRGEPVVTALDDPHASHCAHLSVIHQGHSLCLPLVAGGETAGLLSLLLPAAADAGVARHVANRLGMAIANLQLRETLRQQSIIDPLTGLHNRRHLEESLLRDVARTQREGGTLALLMMDVDHFKNYNDCHGHLAGDEVLKTLGRHLQQSCRSGDLAARYGGEEFTMVMVGIDEATVMARAEQIRREAAELILSHNRKSLPSITLSIGVARFPLHGSGPQELMHAADEALYAAKRGGRNQVVMAAA